MMPARRMVQAMAPPATAIVMGEPRPRVSHPSENIRQGRRWIIARRPAPTVSRPRRRPASALVVDELERQIGTAGLDQPAGDLAGGQAGRFLHVVCNLADLVVNADNEVPERSRLACLLVHRSPPSA